MKKLFFLLLLSVACSFSLMAQTQLLAGMGNYLNPAYHPLGADNSFSFGTGIPTESNGAITNTGAAFASTLGSYQVGVNIWNQNFISRNSDYNLSVSRKFDMGNSWLSTGFSGSYINRSYDVYRLPYRSYTLGFGMVYGHRHHRVGLSLNNFAAMSATIALLKEPSYLSFFYLSTFELGAFDIQPSICLRTGANNWEGHNPRFLGYRDYNVVSSVGLNSRLNSIKAGINLNEFSTLGFNVGYDFKTFSLNYGYQSAQDLIQAGGAVHFVSIKFSPKGFDTGMQMF